METVYTHAISTALISPAKYLFGNNVIGTQRLEYFDSRQKVGVVLALLPNGITVKPLNCNETHQACLMIMTALRLLQIESALLMGSARGLPYDVSNGEAATRRVANFFVVGFILI